MRDRPKLTDAAIMAILQEQYGLSVSSLTFLPIGNDSASSVYRTQAADGATYFVKLRTSNGFSLPSLLVPAYLRECGVPHIVAPILTRTGTPWAPVGDYALTVYPFLDAQNAGETGLSAQQWQALGATLRQIHDQPLPPDLQHAMPEEPFIPTRRPLIDELEAVIAGPLPSDPAAQRLAAFWRSKRLEIRYLAERADELGAQLRQASAPLVLCHADLHTWNVLVDTARQFWIVDWDETILARKERDLMFVIGGISTGLVSPQETASFLAGYGDTAIDPLALMYYRFAWAVQDIAAYGERVFLLPDLGPSSRQEAERGFMNLFKPGSIVDISLTADRSDIEPHT